MSRRTAIVFMVVGVLVAAGPIAIAAATTPDRTVGAMPPVVVGIQGPMDRGKVVIARDRSTRIVSAKAASYHDVSPLERGRVLATYVVGGQTDCGPFPSPCGRTGVRILAPNGTVVWQWSYPVRSVGNSELHDAERLPNGDLLAVGMEYERVMIVDSETKRIRWQWNASRFYTAPRDPTTTDWLHMNDVDRIGPGRYLVSVRNTNQLLIINRGRGVTEVINEDRDPTVLRGQHNPQWLGEGRVLVSDSSNDRVVELHKRNGSWQPYWSVERAGGVEFDWPRDADRLPNGHTLITDSRNHRVVIVDEEGTLVASIRTPKLPYEADVLGIGEPVGGSQAPQQTVPPGTGEGHLPIIGRIYVGLQHSVSLPFWFTQIQLLNLIVGGAFALYGVLLWLSGLIASGDGQPQHDITCRQCGISPTADEHRGRSVLRCPNCGDIKMSEL